MEHNKNQQNKNQLTSTSARRKRLTEEEKRRIAKRRAARRRKVYFFRTLFTAILLLLLFGGFKLVNMLFFSGEVEASAPVNPIEENIQESIDASSYDFIVCLDPGHGFDDEGSRSPKVKGAIERDIVFDIATRVKEILIENNIGVILTHTTNKIPSDYKGDQYLYGLEKRVNYANSLDIDLYVSIHCDFYENDDSITGSRIYYMENGSDNIQQLAEHFSTSILSSMEEAKPLLMPMAKSDAYYVLRYTNVPSVLVETGFLSNKQEAKNMMSDSWRDKMSEGIANGIIESFESGLFD